MNKIKAAMAQFMSGRYGMDQLNKILMIAAFILILAGSFIQVPVLNSLALVVLAYTIFRTYSRNHRKRTAENQRFQRILKKIRNSFLLTKLRIKEAGTHRHIKCPQCGVIIRTSKERGPRRFTCPKCKTEFETNIRV
ncbi:MAG TPA: hypothetical protein DCO79_04670 [Spirochaeta sp.]|nr:hypothetical protein [Spirochaeta sp.]